MIQTPRPVSPTAVAAQPRNTKRTGWQISATAIAVATLMGLWAPDASALALGRVKVLSALGEPLRAEIDIPEITPAETESLRAQPASPEAFQAAGLEYNSSISSVRISVQQRANGRPFLRLSSSRPVSDPFMDLIVEVSWASGRIARDYTMLFDPQGGRGSAPAAVVATPQANVNAPQIALPQTAAPLAAPARSALPDAGRERDALRARALASVAELRSQNAPAAGPQTRQATTKNPTVAATALPASSDLGQVTVRPGDTASRIAAAHLPPSVSLEQMLAALLRANPSAFVNGNINLIKSGAVLSLPDPSEAAALTPDQTRQTLTAQSRDFDTFRRKLATSAPPAAVAAADRSASGKLQTKVQDPKPANSAPDRLTLSQGAMDGIRPIGEVPSRADETRGTAVRTGELQKNIDELNKLREASAAASVAASGGSTTANTPAGAVPSAGATASDKSEQGSAAGPAAAPAASASATTVGPAAGANETSLKPAVAAMAAKPPPIAPAETGMVDQLLDQPLLPAMGLGLIALLAGFGIVRTRQRRKAAEEERAFLAEGSNSQSAPFYSVMGGQEVNTQIGRSFGSSASYAPNQFEGEVDPIAEADVYIAYGRDQEAVQTLTDALRVDPQRLTVRTRLLEVLARRNDVSKFGALAAETRPMVGEQSADWQRISEMGRKLDAANALYRPLLLGAAGTGMFATASAFHNIDLTTDAAAAARSAERAAPSTGFGSMKQTGSVGEPDSPDLDLDLSDFGSLQPSPVSGEAPAVALFHPAAPARNESGPGAPDLDLDLSGFGSLQPLAEQQATAEAAKRSSSDPEMLPAGMSNWLAPKLSVPAEQQPGARAAAANSGLIDFDFDFSSLRLDLNDPVAPRRPELADVASFSSGASVSSAMADDLDEDAEGATKLALAEAFTAIGDGAGARSLLQEVINESAGTVKARAQRLLTTIQ